jgi:hypothetical protein
MHWAHPTFFEQMLYLNVLLKARQLGLTTFIQIFMLDACKMIDEPLSVWRDAHESGRVSYIRPA